tara:strand:- start:109 stop:492 length:384 start_codon:yes stop_codon:yes gene_type:complete
MAKFEYLDYEFFFKNIYNDDFFKECFYETFSRKITEKDINEVLSDVASEELINLMDSFIEAQAQKEYGDGGIYYDAIVFYSFEKYDIYWIEHDGEVTDHFDNFNEAENEMSDILGRINGLDNDDEKN